MARVTYEGARGAAPGVFVPCGACGGSTELVPGVVGSCAVCAATGCVPWDSLSPAARRVAVAAGRLPFRLVREPMEVLG